jgi:hypothetical protein
MEQAAGGTYRRRRLRDELLRKEVIEIAKRMSGHVSLRAATSRCDASRLSPVDGLYRCAPGDVYFNCNLLIKER